jgi:beta-xylosidase
MKRAYPALTRLFAPVLLAALALAGCVSPAPAPVVDQLAPKPLFRDPVYDGAADPTVIYNPGDKKWYMFYTNRRANMQGGGGVEWVHGTPIGIATSPDGATWTYVTQAKINYPGAVADPTWWAPAVVYDQGVFHMFLSYVPGIFSDWNHPRDIIHLTSKDLLSWDYQSTLPLSSHKVIDPGVLHLPDGTWRLWYKDEANGSSCHYADSKDLYTWTDGARVPGLSDASGEAPLAFHWKGHYWFLRDITGGQHGLGLYRSEDATNWQRVSTLVQQPGTGPDDTAVGHHPDIIISNDRAYMFYFTQFGRRTSIQVVELKYDEDKNVLTADRDAPTMINLQPPADLETESKVD